MIGSVIFLCILAAVIFKMVYDHQLAKEKEFGLRLNDSDLRKYWAEAHTDYNDGWTKEHYLNLYYETKELREREKETAEKGIRNDTKNVSRGVGRSKSRKS